MASLVLLAAVLGLVLFTTLRSPLKDDIAWLLYVARRWLAGRELYVDLVEVNPPLIIWFSAIPMLLSDWLGVGLKLAALGWFIGFVLACAWWTASLLSRAGGLFAQRLPVFAALTSVLLLVPGGELGQREHLLVAAMLPYLALFAQAMDRLPRGRVAAIGAGVLAGLGCALKPRYAFVFVGLECVALAYGLWPWRAKPIAAALTMAVYGGAVAIFCPAYLHSAVPMALALYGATDVSLRHLLLDADGLMLGEAIAVLLLCLSWRSMAERSLMLILVTFATISTLVCFADGKNWFYHRLPATLATVLALLLWSASALYHGRVAWRRQMLTGALAAAALAGFAFGTVQRLQPELALALQPRDSAEARLERLIRAEHARTYIAFSEWIALGFPVVNNTGVAWASRFDSMWALKGELWRARFDPSAAKEWPISRWVAHDFIAGCPDLAVVDVRGGPNWVNALSHADPSFARAWSQYKPIDAFDGLVVYRHAAPGCVNPWIAAGQRTGVGEN